MRFSNARSKTILSLIVVAAAGVVVASLLLTGDSAPRKSVAEQVTDGPPGALTFILSDGSRRTVLARNPAEEVPASEPPISAAPASSNTYPSPDGRYRALVRFDQQGMWLDVEARDAVVATFPLAGIVGDQIALGDGKVGAAAVAGVPLAVAWSPDSMRLAFGSVTGAPWTLNLVSVEDWRASVHSVRGGYVGELAWAPDGSFLGVSTYEVGRTDHTVLILDPGEQTARFLIDGCAITWSPDGEYLAVHREPRVEPGVWILSVSGDLLVRASSDPDAFPLAWTN